MQKTSGVPVHESSSLGATLEMNMEKESHELKRPRKICKDQQSNLVKVELYLVTFSDSDFSGIQTIISSKEKMHLKHSSLRPFILKQIKCINHQMFYTLIGA